MSPVAGGRISRGQSGKAQGTRRASHDTHFRADVRADLSTRRLPLTPAAPHRPSLPVRNPPQIEPATSSRSQAGVEPFDERTRNPPGPSPEPSRRPWPSRRPGRSRGRPAGPAGRRIGERAAPVRLDGTLPGPDRRGLLVRRRIGCAAAPDRRDRCGNADPVRRHRPAFPRDARLPRQADRRARADRRAHHRADARGSGSARREARPLDMGPRWLLRLPQGAAAPARPRRVRGLDHRPQALPGGDARAPAGVRIRRLTCEGQSAGGVERRPARRPCRRPPPARPSAGRRGLPLDRLRALHLDRAAGRGWAERPLARPGQDRVRHPPRPHRP